MSKKTNNTEFEKTIRDPNGIWYGPYECPGCGKVIIRKARAQGGLKLDVTFNHHYPNFNWQEHQCTPTGVTPVDIMAHPIKVSSAQIRAGKKRAGARTK